MEKQAKKFMKGFKSNFNKAKRTYSCRTLKDLVRAYRACTSKSEERALVKKEAAHIRDLFREGDRHFQRRNITKLLFFHMNGYPTDFGITECIKLCASSNFADKRVAYLGLTILVDQTEQLLMLMTNSLKQDLNNPDLNIVTLALNVVGDVASAEMLRELLPDIETHMQSPNPQIRKKAGLAAVRAVRKLPPEETTAVLEYTPQFFDTRSSAVHISGAALVSALCEQDANNAVVMQQTVLPIIITILSDHVTGSAPTQPADLYGSTHEKLNPFLLAKLITVLRSLLQYAPPETIDAATAGNIGSLLVSLAAKFEPSSGGNLKMMQCSVLLEVVRTSAYVRAHSPALQDLITNVLGRFLTHREATVRYIALQELNALADIDGVAALDEVSQLREKLLSSLREADRTVRRQGAELVFRTTDASNVSKMVSEMASFVSLSNADGDFDAVRDGCEKMFLMADLYGPDDDWKLDVFVNALTLGHHRIDDALSSCLVSFVSAHQNVRSHAVRALFAAVLQPHSSASSASTAATSDAYSNVVSLLDGDGINPASDVNTIDDAAAVADTNSEKPGAKPKGLPKRMPRAEEVALYVVGEFGGVGGVASTDVVRVCEVLLFGHDGTTAESELDGDEQHVARMASVSQVALTTLLKVAARELGVVHAADSVTVANMNDGGLADMFAGLGLPALPAPPSSGGEQSNNAGSDLAMQLITMGEPGVQTSRNVNNTSSSVGVTDLVALGLGDDGENSVQTSSAVTLFDGGSSAGFNAEGGTVVIKIRQILSKLVTASDVELQQRACEYLSLLDSSSDARAALSSAAAPAPTMAYREVRAVVDEIHAHSHDHGGGARSHGRARARSRGKPVSATGAGNVGLLLDLMADDDDDDDGNNNNTGNAMGINTSVMDDDPLAALGALVVSDAQPMEPTLSAGSVPASGPIDDLLALPMGDTTTTNGSGSGGNSQGNASTVIESEPDAAQGIDSLMAFGMDLAEPEETVASESVATASDAVVGNGEGHSIQQHQGQQDQQHHADDNEPIDTADSAQRCVIAENDSMRIEASMGAVEIVDGEARRQGVIIMTNLSQRRLGECVLQLAVPKYTRLEMEAASGSEADHGEAIRQELRMFNRAHGVKPLQFRYIAGFRLDGDADLTRLQGLADNLP